MKRLFIFLTLIIFPFYMNVNAEATNESFRAQKYGTDYEPSHIGVQYWINEEDAMCLDPNLYNPTYVDSVQTLTVSSGAYAKGLIAMANYAKQNNIDTMTQAHAFRIYTMKKNPKGLNSYGPLDSTYKQSILNYSSDDAIGKMVKIGICAYENNCSSEENSKYIPSSTNSKGNFKITKINDSADVNKKVATATISIVNQSGGSETVVNGCSANGLTCSIAKDSSGNDRYKITVNGDFSSLTSIKVDLDIKGTTGTGFINEIKLYECTGSKGSCNKFITNGDGLKYQRFIKLITSNTVLTSNDSIYISLSKNCKNEDPSLYKEGSKEEDDYIKRCGPIVHLEQSCGKDSCEGDSEYKAFNHSYVRMRNMKYIMQDLDKGNSVDSDYQDGGGVNEYCGSYKTESVDIYTPATAASVSGQFFIFDSYTNTDYDNINQNSYFRQPFIVERVKSTYFFNYKKWLNDYNDKSGHERSTFISWQNSVQTVMDAYQVVLDREADIAAREKGPCVKKERRCGQAYYVNGKWEQDCSMVNVYDSTTCQARLKAAKEAWEATWPAEVAANTSYKNAISARLGVQGKREECIKALKSYAGTHSINLDDGPSVDFMYKQISRTNGTEEKTVSMVNNDKSIKYWPNVTSGKSKNADYLGQNYVGLNSNGENKSGRSSTFTFYKEGSYLSGDHTTTIAYDFPDGVHDLPGCISATGEKGCRTYNADTLSFNSKQMDADADIPYSKDDTNIVLEAKEKVSKIYFYRAPTNYYGLNNTGKYVDAKTLHYTSNAAMNDVNGLEIGYVYNIELTSYQGQYTTSFIINNVGGKSNSSNNNNNRTIQNLINDYIKNNNITSFESTCNYCNMEMAFKRNCDECDETDPGEYLPQFYYRSISLSDVTPAEREDGETNWSDDKGKAAAALIEQGSGLANADTKDNSYIALTDSSDKYNKLNNNEYTYLADSSTGSKYDIYDDYSKKYLEYEVTLDSKDLQMIKRNSSRSYFSYANMNMCLGNFSTTKDSDVEYCFKCNSDMKECESSLVTAYFSNTSGRSKWKYYVDGKFCSGSISSCIVGLKYTTYGDKSTDGVYPDPLFPKQFLNTYKNWP